MRIIDKNGKVFGLINIVDLVILLVIVFAVTAGVYKFSQLNNDLESNFETIKVVIEIEAERNELFQAVKQGDVLLDSVRGTEFGEVISKSSKPHRELVVGKDGKVEYKEIPGAFDIQLEIKSPAVVTEEGILIGRKPTYIGSEVRLKSNLYVFDCKVINIETN